MLNSEQAEKELQKHRVEEWEKSRLAAAQKLSSQLRPLARALIGADDDGEGMNHEKREKLRVEIRPLAGKLSRDQRQTLFEVLFPGLGRVVEDGWQLLRQLPYQNSGRETKSFRAPDHDEALLTRRLAWIESLLDRVGQYPGKDLLWHAAWAGHEWDSDALSVLLAAAIDAGGSVGDEIFGILRASAQGEHEIGVMGAHVVAALLRSKRPDGWEFVEKMLLAAQREEGLRQTILESIDVARPEPFRRMLRLILDHKLVRFSATVRALNVWLGYLWDSVSAGVVNQVIERLLLYLEDPAARDAVIQGRTPEPEQVYLALWAMAFDNAPAALPVAARLLGHSKTDIRFVAAQILARIDLPEAQVALLKVLDDDDLHLPFCALSNLQWGEIDIAVTEAGLFERLEKLLPRFPAKNSKLKPLVWPWTDYTVGRELVSSILLRALGSRPAKRLIPLLPEFSPSERGAALSELAKPDVLDAEVRGVLLAWVGDTSRPVRDAALAGLAKCRLKGEDAPTLENLLTRTAGDLRRGVLGLLQKLPDAAALASTDRLLAAGAAPQRLAGLELLRQLIDEKRCLAEARERAAAYRTSHPRLAEDEQRQIENIEQGRTESISLDDALGLIQHADRTWPAAPAKRNIALHSPAAVRLLAALDDLVHEHREKTISEEGWNQEKTEKLLGEVSYGLNDPKADLPLDQDRARFPLAEIWEAWWAKRPKDLRDADGLEGLRAWVWGTAVLGDEYDDKTPPFRKRCPNVLRAVIGDYQKPKLRHRDVVLSIVKWMLRIQPPAGAPDLILDALETAWAHLPESELRHVPKEDDYDDEVWRDDDTPFMTWHIAPWFKPFAGAAWTPAHDARLFQLFRWRDQPFGLAEPAAAPGKKPAARIDRERPDLSIVLAAHHAGGATDADVIEQLIGLRANSRWGSLSFDDLALLSARREPELLKQYPRARPLLDRCRARVLEVELTRGDTPTPATAAAMDLHSVWGMANLVAILRALGSRNFTRGYARDKDDKETVFSHLARVCFPADGETVADFKRLCLTSGTPPSESAGSGRSTPPERAANPLRPGRTATEAGRTPSKAGDPNPIPEQRLVELAVYAPQWAAQVEHALGWNGLVEGVWWIHAHTRGSDWTVDREIRELWEADLSQRTALTSAELIEGAVDVAWFQRVQAELGLKRWEVLDEAARYASTGTGHARARLFADAMLGRVTKKELITRANQKRYQDAVRALGLLPLAEGKGREADLLERYKLMQEFIRTSRQFGSQRQASEKRAAQIGQENLARTAGYPDPLRLQWAMEARAVADLADGPITATVDGVTVTLAINPWGEIEFTVARGDSPWPTSRPS